VRSNEPFALDNGVFRLRQHGTFSLFFGKIVLSKHNFSKIKDITHRSLIFLGTKWKFHPT
jgi:hypothetical protein